MNLSEPITREEMYYAYMSGADTVLPEPITRREQYLYYLCTSGAMGGATPEQIENAVNNYLEENPVQAGATLEQAAQIEKNKNDIENIKTARVLMTSTDTTATIQPNKLYVFPEMAELSLAFAEPTNTSIANEYHVIFRSGATATILTIPDTVKVPEGFTVEANKVYELSVLEGCLTWQSWEVTA